MQSFLYKAARLTDAEACHLVPETTAWNDGRGIDLESWIGCEGRIEFAIGYSQIFWPSLVRFNGYVLREGFRPEALAGFEQATGQNRGAVEAVMNHLHVLDLHSGGKPTTEAQIRFLGRFLAEIYDMKLRAEFPDLHFIVEFNDEPGLDLRDYQLTFWQADDPKP